ncbi:hypothetical protein S40288_05595 [Stachybotrys chartarum IBT 40288]|nr:hypothetical protein S40288_05595 [Stachybotrys chartarum IBT 40288]
MAEPAEPVIDPGFERQMAENCVEYFLFLIDGQADSRHHLSKLESIRKAALQLSQSLTKDYIWQRDEFQLELRSENGLTYLYGITDYGDAVEDEWLIVYILRELSKSQPKLWIRVCDTDGEFLLIEAANVLPKWLSPETDRNRVWIHNGQLWIISSDKEAVSSHSGLLTLPQAIQSLKSNAPTLVHSDLIEAEAFYRLQKYPAYVNESIHHSLLTIPRKAAYVLHTLPRLIAPAVEAFYLRDPLSLKPIVSQSASLHFPPRDLVTVSVRFSKVLFAQLRSQRFDPPPQWRDILQQARDAEDSDEGTKRFAQLELGMMLTCGLEILAMKAEKSKSRVVRELAITLDDLAEDGEDSLPSDQEIQSWENHDRNDSEDWMNINYEDFERELEGKQGTEGKAKSSGFGNAQTQDDLRKIVARFEAFLNDETAGLEGAELHEMDKDDDDDSESTDEDIDSEDREVSFNEEEFSRMMREMMGMPPVTAPTDTEKRGTADTGSRNSKKASSNEDVEEIRELSTQMEVELKEHGALRLNASKKEQARIKDTEKGKGRDTEADRGEEEGGESDEGEVDIDYNLAKNLLESFKSQGGMAGPTGNMLGMMGFQLPRDEDDGSGNGGPSRRSGGR